MKTWFIAFYQYKDAKTWQRTFLYDNKQKLEDYLKGMDYVNDNWVIQEIQLPE